MDVIVTIPDEEKCAEILRGMRWPSGLVRCVNCSSRRVNRDGSSGAFRKYWCRACGAYFNDKSRTIFQDSKLPLSKWFEISLLLVPDNSVAKISKKVGVSYRNAYYVVKKLRSSGYSVRIAEALGAAGRGIGGRRASAIELQKGERALLRAN